MQLVMAAMTTAPWLQGARAAAVDAGAARQVALGQAEAALLDRRRQEPCGRLLHRRSGHAVLGPLGSGQAGLHRAEVQLERVA